LDTNFDINLIRSQTEKALGELLSGMDYPPGSVFVLGCSSSEVCGGMIGRASNEEAGRAIIGVVLGMVRERGYALAVQCCEHLNRALVIEEETAIKRGFEIVSAVPALNAGGACALAAYRSLGRPVLVEHVIAVAGMDIGDTFIGMHLKHVAVPVRLSVREIGAAHVTAAKSRPKLIGGERARYKPLGDVTDA